MNPTGDHPDDHSDDRRKDRSDERSEDRPDERPKDRRDGTGDEPVNETALCDHVSCRDEPRLPGSLADRYPDLVKEWDCSRAGPSPWTVRPATDKKLHWFHITPDGTRHHWTATGGSRARLGSGCGVCTPRKGATPGINDLASRRRDVATQWCTTHNQGRRSETVTPGSKYKACWICGVCGYHSRLPIYAKTAGNKCRRCAGQVALPGDPGTLAVAAPQRYAELDTTQLPAGLDPATVLLRSNRVLTWICRHCHQSYRATPAARANGVGCPHCSRHSSAVERDLREALRERLPSIEPGSVAIALGWDSGAPTRPRRHSLRVDIADLGLRVAVEYDGYVYHRRDDVTLRDLTKTRLLLDHGWTVIRVRENDLPDLDLTHPRLHHVRHTWGHDVDDLADRLATLIRRATDPGPDSAAPSTGPKA